ncbi:MAG: hypothetical protein C5B59_08840 [Bacteroidetes bacterium]|nr:MAG: hypothetical protein C5B59_08840 [Bacteroidota bacterium]
MSVEISAPFFVAYSKLLRIEGYLTQMILDPRASMKEFVENHNIIEDAKLRIVQAYLPINVRTNQ